jgi:hypothetical protein
MRISTGDFEGDGLDKLMQPCKTLLIDTPQIRKMYKRKRKKEENSFF